MKVLLLAGTNEARRLAQALAEARIDTLASLSGATRVAQKLPVPTRVGGFGGAAGFLDVIKCETITHVIDATHPFAHQITDRTHCICTDNNIPYLHILRPEWHPEQGDNWTMISNEEDAAHHIPSGSTVFLATGRQTLPRYSGLKECRVICRQIDPPDEPFPFPGGEFLVSRPPFTVEDEEKLFRALNVDYLVVKNAGGVSSRTKLDAARELNIPVLMLRRPKMPDAERAESPEQAMAWLKNQ